MRQDRLQTMFSPLRKWPQRWSMCPILWVWYRWSRGMVEVQVEYGSHTLGMVEVEPGRADASN